MNSMKKSSKTSENQPLSTCQVSCTKAIIAIDSSIMLIGRVQYQVGFLTVCRVALFFQTYVAIIIYRFNGFAGS